MTVNSSQRTLAVRGNTRSTRHSQFAEANVGSKKLTTLVARDDDDDDASSALRAATRLGAQVMSPHRLEHIPHSTAEYATPHRPSFELPSFASPPSRTECPYWSHLNRHRSCTCIRVSVLVTSEPSLGRYGREKYQRESRQEMESSERKKESAQKLLFVGLVTSKGQSEESRREKKSEKESAQKLHLHWPLSLMTSKGQSAENRKGKEIMNKKKGKKVRGRCV